MKIVNSEIEQVRQGDCLITRIDELPNGLTQVTPENNRFIVAHSETGHHHVIEAANGVELYNSNDPFISYLHVIDTVEITLEHLREFDKHEAYLLKGGTYEIRRQRERSPDGWRRVDD